MSKYKFGIIGCGLIAHYHAQSINSLDNCQVTAVCDYSLEKAQDFANEYGIEDFYDDYQKLLVESDVDIISVCAVSGVHAEIVVAAANAGKHILCEKPIGITREELDNIEQSVLENQIKFQGVFQSRTEQHCKAVKEAVENNIFGSVIIADAYLKFYRSQEYYDSGGWRGTWELDGGGALMNQGIHGIDILLWIAGEVESVFARTDTKARDIEVEDTAVAILKFKNGAFGVIEGTTSVYPGYPRKFEIHGKKGTVVFNTAGIEEWQIEGENDSSKPELKKIETDDTSSNPMDFSKLSHVPLVKDLVDAIETDRETLIPVSEARKAVDLILAIYESSQKGKEIFLG